MWQLIKIVRNSGCAFMYLYIKFIVLNVLQGSHA